MQRLIICLDCGDTIVDESTQTFSPNGDALSAKPISGAVEAVRALHALGYRLALVADGRTASFENILKGVGLWDIFDARAISEEVGVEKPSPLMFLDAMQKLGLGAQDAARMVMIGNNVERDIVGANRMGMISVLQTFSPRYRMEPRTGDEEPAYRVTLPTEWVQTIRRIEQDINKRQG